jgi:RNA polymerase sigma-70 factor (ECF subfamily)
MNDDRPHEDVVAAAAAGDDAALTLLVRRYHDRVYRFGLRVCRDGYDADDAVQEAFTKLARRPDVSRDTHVLSWLFAVVRNACRRLQRPFMRERRTLGERLEDAETVVASDPDPEAALERWRLVHAVHESIAKLPPPQREVLILRDLEGLSAEEVCRVLGLSEATMKSRLHRARRQLRSELGRLGGGSARQGWN